MANLREDLLYVLDNFETARTEEFAGHPIKEVIKDDIPAAIKEILSDTEHLRIRGSAGKGHWTSTPYVAIMDKRETKSPQEGIYVDYLFKSDEEKVFLAIDQGYTNLTDEYGKKEGEKKLERRKSRVREKINLNDFNKEFPEDYSDSNLSPKSKIVFLEYSRDNFPSQEKLEEDLQNLVEEYQDYISENSDTMKYDEKGDPNLFLAPCSNSDAYAHLRDTVIRRVPTETVNEFSNHEFQHDVVSVWGNREGTESKWRQIEKEDFLLFYKEGEYIYGAEIIDTETNTKLGKNLWPDDSGDPWKHIIYLKEPFRLELSHDEINELADYSENYNLMGFQPLNDEGIKSIKEKYGSVRNFLQEKKTGSASDETEFIDYTSETKYTELEDKKTADYEEEPPVNILEKLEIELPESLLDNELHYPDDQSKEIINQVQAALNSGKNIIFTGPPGTGKTEIARIVAKKLEGTDYFTGHQLTTATADWSTFDTVGGFMPEKEGDGDLEFNSGQILKRFKDDDKPLKNELLVIDEINRADIDKAFGQLFTVLSGQKVQLPFTADNNKEIEVIPGDDKEATDRPKEHQFIVPESWRILATMNTYDKTSLYEMSYAFMRRFAFIRVDAPNKTQINDELMETYISSWDIDVNNKERDAVKEIWKKTNSAVDGRKIGPSIAMDMLGFLQHGSGKVKPRATKAVVNYIFPQLEGVRKNDQIVKKIAENTESVERDELKRVARDMLKVKIDE